ncbi:polyprenyl synthetase family protein [Dasania sp. GY-MA-18]|uniref:Octaprenyl diphosphate synthase n=1 Tax=Dasania phycosphaerae TaxID=2950436 RepID=A0A9J6RRA9_9GAMM|nr:MULTISPECIES: polyprenyl synthetase family protein [Dasania]MCR8924131.1 polyprenyl synthetase family protein [Dasania sp. GY-MA-18]MCZ0866704.1 polyprenyl synthetase family protein [Dasania phycosphaerae]MCZ0870289.1 polyprenyl synthetase family protein [Dasania phycosphaerae]
MQQARDIVATEFEAVNQLIIDHLHSRIPLVGSIGHYIVDAGGKRLRPLLALLCGGINGNIGQQHIAFAASIEFIHTATLLHDDVVDISSLRRGRPTANAEWGNAPSVLVGDFLYTRAFQLLVSLGKQKVMELMANTTNIIAEGEVLQLTKAGDPSTSEADYFDVIKSKTAVLFAAACAGSGELSELDQASISKLYDYGLNLGIAFQLIDDVLDYEGDPETMGKNVGDDLAEGKPTLPLIHVMKQGSSEQQALVSNAIKEKNSSELNAIFAAIQDCDALNYTRLAAIKHQQLATAAISDFAPSAYKDTLLRLAELSVNRHS